MMRLDKYLCETGFGTRSQVKDLLKKGQVMVNGEVVKKPELKINETTDQILCQGKKASYQKNIYLMLHKPAGVVSATEDNREKTVLDLVRPEDRKNGLFPVGRLDKDTEGLLLFSEVHPYKDRSVRIEALCSRLSPPASKILWYL